MRKILIRNILAAVLLNIVNILNGFIVPKTILIYFGSEVNGLTNSIIQFLNYIQLLEGGLTAVIMSALYEPLLKNDIKKISAIMKATQYFFKKIAIIYVLYTTVIAFVYPLFVKSKFSYQYVVVLVFVLASGIFVQYFFSLSLKILLNADQKVFFVSLSQIVLVIINLIVVVISAKFFKDIVIVKLLSSIVFFLQPVVYSLYVNKHYKIDQTVDADQKALSQRWDGFSQNIAYFIHTNTDIVILTIFSTLKYISIYSVYFMVINSLKSLIMSISQAISPSFGRVLAGDDKEESNRIFDLYDFSINYISTLLFTCGILLVTSFVHVYTKGITDADYNQPLFGFLIGLAEWVYCLRDPYVSAAYAAGHFKQTAKYAYIESLLNIAISLLLVQRLGIVGVAIGTLMSMIYRMISHALYLKNNILRRHIEKFIKKICVYGSSFLISSVVYLWIRDLRVDNYIQWIGVSAMVFLFVLIVTTVLSLAFYKDEFMKIIGERLRRR